MVPHKCAGIKAKRPNPIPAKPLPSGAVRAAKSQLLDGRDDVGALWPIAALRPARYSPRNRTAPLEGATHVQRTA